MSPEIEARAEKLLRRMAGQWSFTEDGGDFASVATGIIRDLDRERDPDIAAAERIARSHCGNTSVAAILNGIKYGRETPSQEASNVG